MNRKRLIENKLDRKRWIGKKMARKKRLEENVRMGILDGKIR